MKRKHIIASLIPIYAIAIAWMIEAPLLNFTPAPSLPPPLTSVPGKRATISLTPGNGEIIVGNTIVVTAIVNAESAINAVSAQIKFPQEYVEAVTLSKEDSMINLWSEEPSFSNETGTITFSGISTAGGIKGKRTALAVVFKSKKLGRVNIEFADAQVLAHDGQGTDIVGEKIGAAYTIVEKPMPPRADINGDGTIGLADVSIIVFHFGKINTAAAKYDLSGDGKVNLADLSILISMMGKK